jgi:hypothetical protein
LGGAGGNPVTTPTNEEDLENKGTTEALLDANISGRR